MPWEEACSKAEKLTGDYEGFYLSNKVHNIITHWCLTINHASYVYAVEIIQMSNYQPSLSILTPYMCVCVFSCVGVSRVSCLPNRVGVAISFCINQTSVNRLILRTWTTCSWDTIRYNMQKPSDTVSPYYSSFKPVPTAHTHEYNQGST